MKTYSTRELAEAARTTLRTIRFWESQGLFAQVERDRLGERLFTEEHLQRARVISAASMAGMSLDDIKNRGNLIMAARISDAIFFMQAVRGDMKDFDL